MSDLDLSKAEINLVRDLQALFKRHKVVLLDGIILSNEIFENLPDGEDSDDAVFIELSEFMYDYVFNEVVEE